MDGFRADSTLHSNIARKFRFLINSQSNFNRGQRNEVFHQTQITMDPNPHMFPLLDSPQADLEEITSQIL